jgi:hypothetical protein
VKDYYNFENTKKENDYDQLTLFNLIKLIKKYDSNLYDILKDDNIRIKANQCSHDSGESISLNELKDLRDNVIKIFIEILNNIKNI